MQIGCNVHDLRLAAPDGIFHLRRGMERGRRLKMESRVLKAVATFEEGYNCCQSVFSTYADLFGMDRETALKLSCSMGAGVGRMREVCGTVSAMALLAGLKTGNTDPQNQAAKTANYELVRRLADAFKEEQGAIVCREILGIRGREKSAAPSIRTKEYYRTRPCSRTVACASRIIEALLLPELFGEDEGTPDTKKELNRTDMPDKESEPDGAGIPDKELGPDGAGRPE